jgi:hypothetical protein
VKVDQQIINNLQEAEEMYLSNKYKALDEIVIRKCFGVGPDLIDIRYMYAVLSWLISSGYGHAGKGKEEVKWKTWFKEIKERFYTEFISGYRKYYSMLMIFDGWYAHNYVPKNDAEEAYKKDMKKLSDQIEQWGSSKEDAKLVFAKSVGESWPDLPDEDKIVYHKYNCELWVFIDMEFNADKKSRRLELEGVRIHPLNKKDKVENIAFKQMIPLEKYTEFNRGDITKEEFIGRINEFNGDDEIKVSAYELFYELYTGYLKYGSVDNYIKYCQEDDQRVALNTKIA